MTRADIITNNKLITHCMHKNNKILFYDWRTDNYSAGDWKDDGWKTVGVDYNLSNMISSTLFSVIIVDEFLEQRKHFALGGQLKVSTDGVTFKKCKMPEWIKGNLYEPLDELPNATTGNHIITNSRLIRNLAIHNDGKEWLYGEYQAVLRICSNYYDGSFPCSYLGNNLRVPWLVDCGDGSESFMRFKENDEVNGMGGLKKISFDNFIKTYKDHLIAPNVGEK